MDGGLVVVDEFHYSPKGKEVNHYKLANKYIIIAPKSTYGIREKLKNILPMVGLSIVATGFVYLFTKRIPFAAEKMAAATAEEPALYALPQAKQAIEEMAVTAVPEVSASIHFYQQLWFWFLIGSLFAIVIYMLIAWRRKE